VYRAGRGAHSSYRPASPADLDYVKDDTKAESTDTLVWGAVYRHGAITRDTLASHVALPAKELDASLCRLVEAGHVTRSENDGVETFSAGGFVLPMGSTFGWEAAVFDHFQALVTTVLAKLRMDAGASAADLVGGSTYTLEVWEGHPLQDEAMGELRAF